MRVCKAAYTIVLKYAGITAVLTLFMIASILVPRAENQFFSRVPIFNSSWLTLMTTEIPVWHDHDVRTVWQVAYNLKGL